MQYFQPMHSLKNTAQKTCCDRCGSCCRQGGPALHTQDRELFTDNLLCPEHLITVRRGELAYQPMAQHPQPVTDEFLKVAGKRGDWCCRFYDHAAKKCTIYGNRPIACGLFDCTSPEEILAITGKDLLTRFDLIEINDPLLSIVKDHEKQCPCPDFLSLPEQLARDKQTTLERLTPAVRLDLDIRATAAYKKALSVELEMFYFGRPLFQLLRPFGIVLSETDQGVCLHSVAE